MTRGLVINVPVQQWEDAEAEHGADAERYLRTVAERGLRAVERREGVTIETERGKALDGSLRTAMLNAELVSLAGIEWQVLASMDKAETAVYELEVADRNITTTGEPEPSEQV